MEQSPDQNNLNTFKSGSEKLDIKIEIANLNDWEDYKKIRLLAITGKDAEMFGVTEESLKAEQERTDKDWQDDLNNPNMFVVLARNGKEVVGMSIAKQRYLEEPDIWWMGSAFTKENFQNSSEKIGKKMFQNRLDEIKKRGGKLIELAIKNHNLASIHIAESFGFKKVDEHSDDTGSLFELYLTK